MEIWIADADLLAGGNRRFPNLASMKISGYWKELGASVHLCRSWQDAAAALRGGSARLYVSRVFTDTPVPDFVRPGPRVHLGGTGFYFDHAPPLPDVMEHHMPDYHLYDGYPEPLSKEYRDYSIGFLTRGCFRHCGFCVNREKSRVVPHSPLEEFHDPERPKLCFLDDNFLGCPDWKKILTGVLDTGKPFRFKQGLDERLLTDEKCEMIFSGKLDGDVTFAFDRLQDREIIEDKLAMIRRHTDRAGIKFYVLSGYPEASAEDLAGVFERIGILMKYRCLPYVMRYAGPKSTPWKASRYAGMYTAVARWCNQPFLLKKKSFREFIELDRSQRKNHDRMGASERAAVDFEAEHPEIARRYFDMKWGQC